jgi:hypothetical protein
VPPRITQQDLEKRYTPRQVKQLFIDDGSNTPGDRLAEALEEASRQGDAILRRVWTSDEQLDALVETDAAVRGAYCALAMAIGAEAHPEWWANGEGPYAASARRARQTLKDMTDAVTRPRGEIEAGANTLNDVRTVTPDPQFVFAPSGGKNPSGGF